MNTSELIKYSLLFITILVVLSAAIQAGLDVPDDILATILAIITGVFFLAAR